MKRSLLLILVLILILSPVPSLAAIKVVASIRPLHALTSSLLQGVAEPELVVSATGSPHGYRLRPSEMRMLQQADLLIWVGPDLETFLARPLAASRPEGQRRLNLLKDVPTLQILPARQGGRWNTADDVEEGRHDHDHGHVDPHIWLSPENARLIARAIFEQLTGIDPGNIKIYRENYDRLDRQLLKLSAQLTRRLQPLREKRYIVFHDAYQYFEKAFSLNPVGALAIDPERRPGVRRLTELRAELRQKNVECVFSEPQFEPRLIRTLIEGTTVRTGVLDPLGTGLSPGPDLYRELLEDMADELVTCLGGDSGEGQ